MENIEQEEVVVEATATPEAPATSGAKSFIGKVKALPKKVWIAIAAAVVVLIGAIIGGFALGNTPPGDTTPSNTPITPIELYFETLNNKMPFKSYDLWLNEYNGFLEKEYKEIRDLRESFGWATDGGDQAGQTERRIKYYGDDYKYSYEIVEKVKLDEDQLKKANKSFETSGKIMESFYGSIEDWDSDDWEDEADHMGITVSQAKSLYEIYERIATLMVEAKVTEGYEITVEITLTGSKMDEPAIREETFTVLKVNGRWIRSDMYYAS